MAITDPGNPGPDIGDPVPMPGGPAEPATPILPDPNPEPDPNPIDS